MSSPPLPPSNPVSPVMSPSNSSTPDALTKSSERKESPSHSSEPPILHSITAQQIADFHIVEACIDSVNTNHFFFIKTLILSSLSFFPFRLKLIKQIKERGTAPFGLNKCHNVT